MQFLPVIYFSRLSPKPHSRQRRPVCPSLLSPLHSLEYSCHPSLCLFQFAIYFLEGLQLEFVLHLTGKISSEPHGINTTLPLQKILCLICPRVTLALFFVASYWQLTLVPFLLLSLSLASYKLFSKKLLTPSRRACAFGKQKVPFRVSFRFS